MKKPILRTCVITKEKCEKKDLLRIVRTPDKNIVFDESGKIGGKGAYLKKDIEVIKKAQKSKVLDRIFEMEVNDEVYEMLLGKVSNE